MLIKNDLNRPNRSGFFAPLDYHADIPGTAHRAEFVDPGRGTI